MIKCIREIMERQDGKEIYAGIMKVLRESGQINAVCRYSSDELKAAVEFLEEHEYSMNDGQSNMFWGNYCLEKEKQLISRFMKTKHDVGKEVVAANAKTVTLVKRAWEQYVVDADIALKMAEINDRKLGIKPSVNQSWDKIKKHHLRFKDET